MTRSGRLLVLLVLLLGPVIAVRAVGALDADPRVPALGHPRAALVDALLPSAGSLGVLPLELTGEASDGDPPPRTVLAAGPSAAGTEAAGMAISAKRAASGAGLLRLKHVPYRPAAPPSRV